MKSVAAVKLAVHGLACNTVASFNTALQGLGTSLLSDTPIEASRAN